MVTRLRKWLAAVMALVFVVGSAGVIRAGYISTGASITERAKTSLAESDSKNKDEGNDKKKDEDKKKDKDKDDDKGSKGGGYGGASSAG